MANIRNLTEEQKAALQEILERMATETDEEKLKRLIVERDLWKRRVERATKEIHKLQNKLYMRKVRKSKQ